MRLQRNYYEILGLPQSATRAEIKKRYRELARKFHPDVVQDKSFGQRAFVQINEAYQTLSDPVQRREYDRKLRAEALGPSASTIPTAASSRPGRTVAAPDSLIRDAEFAFIRGRLNQAANLCREAVRQNRSPARAHSILGDIYRIQGKMDQAISEYTVAAQLDPKNQELAAKLNRLLQRDRPRRPRESSPRNRAVDIRAAARAVALNTAGWSVSLFLFLLLSLYPGQPALFFRMYLPLVSQWSWNLVAVVLADSVLVGALMCATGLIDHPDDELIFESAGTRSVVTFPTGLFLVLFAGIFYWGAAALYLIISLLQESLSRSVARVFGATSAIVLLAAIAYQDGWQQVMLLAGNLAFVGMVVGWYIGAAIRPLAMD